MKTTIKTQGKAIDCYGRLDESSNIAIEGDYPNGDELSTYDTTGGYTSWTQAVNALLNTLPTGSVLYELSAV